MTNDNNNAVSALNAYHACLRDTIALHMQVDLFEHVLLQHQQAVDNLSRRQVEQIPLPDEPDFTANLVHDVMAVVMSLAGVSAHAKELVFSIQKVARIQHPQAQAS